MVTKQPEEKYNPDSYSTDSKPNIEPSKINVVGKFSKGNISPDWEWLQGCMHKAISVRYLTVEFIQYTC